LADGGQFIDTLRTGGVGIQYLFDIRQRNVALLEQSGIDLAVDYAHSTAAGLWSIRVTAAYIDKIETSFGGGSQVTDLVDTYNNPVDWRLRVDAGWNTRQWSLNGSLNYVDDYLNSAVSGTPAIESWTTVDFVGSVNLGEIFSVGALQGTSLCLVVQNAFDEPPPFVARINPTLATYDTANANPLGRFVAMQIKKAW
jgi:iron complex outermembrane recepter protein